MYKHSRVSIQKGFLQQKDNMQRLYVRFAGTSGLASHGIVRKMLERTARQRCIAHDEAIKPPLSMVVLDENMCCEEVVRRCYWGLRLVDVGYCLPGYRPGRGREEARVWLRFVGV